MPQVTIEHVDTDDQDVFVTLEIDGKQVKVAIPKPEDPFGDWIYGNEDPVYLNLVLGGGHYT